METKDIIHRLRELRDEVKGNYKDPVALSETVVKLATYLTELGEHLPILENAYLNDRSQEYTALLTKKVSVSAAETQARYNTLEKRLDYEKVKQFHKDFDRLVSTLQSYLKIKSGELKGG